METHEIIRKLRKELGLTQEELAVRVGYTDRSTIAKIEAGKVDLPQTKIALFAKALGVSPAALMGITVPPQPGKPMPATAGAALISFPVIAAVKAGYDGQAREEYTGSLESIPAEDLRGRSPEDFMVLRVNGNSMYPLLLDGDRILVERTASVDSGSLAVVLYNGEDATVKRVRYVYGEDWLELIPQNPEYQTKRIEGPDLEECRVLGRVLKLIRTLE